MENVINENAIQKGGENVVIPQNCYPMVLENLKETLMFPAEENDVWNNFKVTKMEPLNYLDVDTYLYKIETRFSSDTLSGLITKMQLLSNTLKDYNLQYINFNGADYSVPSWSEKDETIFSVEVVFEIILKL